MQTEDRLPVRQGDRRCAPAPLHPRAHLPVRKSETAAPFGATDSREAPLVTGPVGPPTGGEEKEPSASRYGVKHWVG